MANKQTITGIFNKIDELDDSRNVKELISKIKPILAELAYYSITGDGAVMEMRENWHSNFTGYIREAAQANSESTMRDSTMRDSTMRGGMRGMGDGMGGGIGDGIHGGRSAYVPQAVAPGYYQQPTFYQKKTYTPESMPTSLENIMKGTHISFSNN